MVEHRNHDAGQAGKRGWFAPIVLVLLTFSLMGNVFLFAGRLQDGQIRKQQEGLALIRQMKETKTFSDSVASSLAELMQGDGPEARAVAQSKLAYTLGGSEAVEELIGQADLLSHGMKEAPSQENPAEAAEAAIAAIREMASGIGTHSGPLTAGERAYAESLLSLVDRMRQSAAALPTDFETKQAAMQVRAGGDWVAVVAAYAKLLSEAGELKPTG